MIDENTAIPTKDPLLRRALLVAFKGRCFYTGRELTADSMHVDHIVPKSRGGRDCIANYVPSCATINLKKSAGVHRGMASVVVETVRSMYAPKVVEVFNALLQYGQYPRPKGRPEVPEAARLKVITVRVTEAQKAKLAALGGGEWLRSKIDSEII